MVLVSPRPGFVNNDQPARAWSMEHGSCDHHVNSTVGFFFCGPLFIRCPRNSYVGRVRAKTCARTLYNPASHFNADTNGYNRHIFVLFHLQPASQTQIQRPITQNSEATATVLLYRSERRHFFSPLPAASIEMRQRQLTPLSPHNPRRRLCRQQSTAPHSTVAVLHGGSIIVL